LSAKARVSAASWQKFFFTEKSHFYEYEEGQTSYFDLASAALKPLPEPPGIIILKSLKDRSREVQKNSARV